MYANKQKQATQIQKTYVFAKCESFIEYFAKSNNLISNDLTLGVAELLQLQASGKVSRISNNMPTLRRKSTKSHKTTRKMALASRSYRKTQLDKRLKRNRKRLHWTQQPKNRKKVLARVLEMRKIKERMAA